MQLVERFQVMVPYVGPNTISRLIERIRQEANPPSFVDARLTDGNFPQPYYGLDFVSIDLVSFDWWVSHKEDTLALLSANGYEPVTAAELLALRASNPRLECAYPITAPRDPWEDPRGYRYVPCIHSGAGNGIRLRTINSGWAPFWRFAVKKTKSV